MNKPEVIEIPPYWSTGTGRMFLREALPFSHPEHTYNYVKNTLGVNPEDYGIFDEKTTLIREELASLSREELMGMVANLRMKLNAIERAGF